MPDAPDPRPAPKRLLEAARSPLHYPRISQLAGIVAAVMAGAVDLRFGWQRRPGLAVLPAQYRDVIKLQADRRFDFGKTEQFPLAQPAPAQEPHPVLRPHIGPDHRHQTPYAQ